MLGFVGQAAPAKPDFVMLCYLATASRNDADPKRLTPSGEYRLLGLRFPHTADTSINVQFVQVYDPTKALLGRSIKEMVQSFSDGSIGLLTESPTDEILAMTISAPEAGNSAGRASVVRSKGDKIVSTLIGRCGMVSSDNPDNAFADLKKMPDTSQ